ncbi:MAG: DUF2339 domain-containing protein [Lysobacteraceae bacterium]
MHGLLAMVGAFFGAILGGIHEVMLGLVAGALLGWQGARIGQLRQRIAALERQAAALDMGRAAAAAMAAGQTTKPPAQNPSASDNAVADARVEAARAVATPATGASAADAAQRSPHAPHVPAEPPAAAALAARAPTATAASASAGSGGRVAHAPATAATRIPSPISAQGPRQWPTGAVEDNPPSPFARLLARGRDWLFSGNVPVKIGVLVLLFGVAAALKYSVDAGWVQVPLAARLALVAAGGLAAVVWGWRNRLLRPAFGLSMQGGGIGILLLTVFAAYRLYALLPSGIAFALVLVLVAGAAALAVLQHAMALAVLGFLGGYLAPVLLSTGEGSHVALFSFYAVLNAAVFVIAWLRQWRALNLIGFAFTFAIGLAWGVQYYRPEHLSTVAPFLLLFFLFYVAIAVLHALRAPGRQRGFVDGTLVFGTPLLAFPLLAAMLHHEPMTLAWCALAVALLYAGLAFWLIRKRGAVLLGQSFATLAVGFATLAVPLAFSARWTCVTWALEGAALVWLGLRQRRLLPQVAGIALQVLAAGAYFLDAIDGGWHASAGEWPLLNGHALGVALLAASTFAISLLYERAGKRRLWVWPGFILGTLWWWWLGLREIEQHVAAFSLSRFPVGEPWAWVGFSALTMLLMAGLRRGLDWPRPGWNVLLTLLVGIPLALLIEGFDASALQAPLAGVWLVWIAAALLGLASLRTPLQRGLSFAHVAFLSTLALVYGLALGRWANEIAALGSSWVLLACLAPLIALLLLTARAPALGTFPLQAQFPRYAARWFVPAGIVLVLAWLMSLQLDGDAAPLPFVPLFNPLELAQLIGLIVAGHWLWRRSPDGAPLPLAIAGFVFLSLAGLRAVHHYSGVPWSPQILDNGTAQATLTVLWSIAGVIAWVSGSRRQHWNLWLAGALGMGLVLAKLVLVDRQYVGNLAGIVSFIAVGGLLVLVGRIAPTPPRHEPAKDTP